METVSAISERKECQIATALEISNESLLYGFLYLHQCPPNRFLKPRAVSTLLKKFNNAVLLSKYDGMDVDNFVDMGIVSRGHRDEYEIVRDQTTRYLYDMKIFPISDLLAEGENSCFDKEYVTMESNSSRWVTEIFYAFVESDDLYILTQCSEQALSSIDYIYPYGVDEDVAKFYMAELAIAINNLHDCGYLHRGIQLGLIHFDSTGRNIDVIDGGSCLELNDEKKVCSNIRDDWLESADLRYVAPELVLPSHKSKPGISYGPEIDWWSFGICVYELLYGIVPFDSDNGCMACVYDNRKIEDILEFPEDVVVSEEAKDLIKKLLTDGPMRLSFLEIKAHPFFQVINWETIRENKTMYVSASHGLEETDQIELSTMSPIPNTLGVKLKHA